MSDLYMGIDIGTTGVRAALFDRDGNQKSIDYKEYPMICAQPGMAELDPSVVFSAFLEVTRNCINNSEINPKYIQAIGLGTQLFSFMALDREGNCLTNVITWADNRPLAQAEAVSREYDCSVLYIKKVLSCSRRFMGKCTVYKINLPSVY